MKLFSLGESYKSTEEASGAKRRALLVLCAVIVFQTLVYLFFWWMSRFDNSNGFDPPSPIYDISLLILFAFLLYFFNSRVLATALVALAAIELFVTWVLKASVTGNFVPPTMALNFVLIAIYVAVIVFKTYEWQQKSGEKAPRPKWVMLALVITVIVVLVGFFLPAFDFLIHTRYKVSLTEKGNVIEYYEPMDKYSLEFPTTWSYDHPPMEYGNVILARNETPDVSVRVERWQPWSIAPISIFNRDAFLKMAQDEADAYSEEKGATVEVVELIGPTSVNETRAIYRETDGSKTYVYYLYNRSWSRQTSDAAYFFWRLTATVPREALSATAEVETIMNSFKVSL